MKEYILIEFDAVKHLMLKSDWKKNSAVCTSAVLCPVGDISYFVNKEWYNRNIEKKSKLG